MRENNEELLVKYNSISSSETEREQQKDWDIISNSSNSSNEDFGISIF